jgi:hypothetical protein
VRTGLHELKIPNNADEKEGVYAYMFYLLSFACAKESNKEKHTGNDIQPLPDAVI